MVKKLVKYVKNAVIINGVIHELVQVNTPHPCTQCSLKSICPPMESICEDVFGEDADNKRFAEVKTKIVMSN